MTRYLLYRRYWERVEERLRRRNLGVKLAWQGETPPPPFIDYWPQVPGTLPEKMLFAELIRRQVNFYFSYYWGDMPFTEEKQERYRPDFILPDYRIIIEAPGYYWHTRPGMYEYDAAKYALYIMAGWQVYLIPDFDILNDVVAAVDQIPELINPAVRGNNVIIGDRPFDPIASALGRARRYPKVVGLHYRRSIRAGRRVLRRWAGGKKVVKPKPVPRAIFSQEHFDETYVQELQEYGQEWRQWIEDLGDYFVRYPEARETYPDIWEMYDRWKDWWDRFTTSPPS